ncbi:hypothetical protein C8R44DRAFT_873278 [Mycena epipterygia]|nr:hypothetical protein C8R44DRAFT_873278 [Mycena epipterygia]
MHIPLTAVLVFALFFPTFGAHLPNNSTSGLSKRVTKPVAVKAPTTAPPQCSADPDDLPAVASVTHFSAKGTIRLFHGTNKYNADSLQKGVDLNKSVPTGDFHHRTEYEWTGAGTTTHEFLSQTSDWKNISPVFETTLRHLLIFPKFQLYNSNANPAHPPHRQDPEPLHPSGREHIPE